MLRAGEADRQLVELGLSTASSLHIALHHMGVVRSRLVRWDEVARALGRRRDLDHGTRIIGGLLAHLDHRQDVAAI